MAEVTDDRRAIPAKEILDKIRNGESVEYDNVIINGDLDISKLVVSKENEMLIINSPIKISNSEIRGKVSFIKASFKESINFKSTHFRMGVNFSGSIFNKIANFNESISEYAYFIGTTFDIVRFKKTTIKEIINFSEATFKGEEYNDDDIISGDADFTEAIFREAYFNGAVFAGHVYFDRAIINRAEFNKVFFRKKVFFDGAAIQQAYFNEATFNNNVYFDGSKFEGDALSFQNARFVLEKSQEEACRRAKIVMAKAGNRDAEEYHFYREMEAKRKQKLTGYEDFDYEALLFDAGLSKEALNSKKWGFINYIMNIFEYIFIQKIFGYGVHPFWLFGWWLAFVATFILIYWIWSAVGIQGLNGEIINSSNLSDYIWFSIATAATPGYALYKPLGGFKIVAGIEAIIGTFMWAAFITTFARKFSR